MMKKELYKRTCYLHIGTTKTGTTAIQSTLDLNRGLLNKKNFFMISNEIREGNSDYKLSISFRNFYKEPCIRLSIYKKNRVPGTIHGLHYVRLLIHYDKVIINLLFNN